MNNSPVYIKNIDKLQDIFSQLNNAEELYLYSSLEEGACKDFNINYISFSQYNEEEYVIKPKQFNNWEQVIDKIGRFLNRSSMLKVVYNLKDLFSAFRNYGIELGGNFFDIEVAMYLVEGEESDSFCSLKNDVLLKNDLSPGKIIYSLYEKLMKELKDKQMHELFKNIEIPLIKVLSSMEIKGISVDLDYLSNLLEEINKKLNNVRKSIYEISGEKFNINSPQQVAHILFEKLKLPVIKRGKTGPSTNTEVLQKLSTMHSLPGDLLKYRELKKLKSSYVKKILNLAKECNGRIHTTFDQCIASTGRLISNKPNLQNIPISGKDGKDLRKAFIAEADSFLLSADYSQIELRILAHFTEDKELTKRFKKDEDIHTHTASLIFDVSEKKVTKKMRRVAKTVNFGIIYGISSYGLSRQLDMSPEQASNFINKYFDNYPKVKEYIQQQKRKLECGYIETIFGRKRYVKKSKDSISNTSLHRIAVNTPIQGTAADIIKLAMVNIYEAFASAGLDSYMALQIHDELIFNVSKEEEKKVLNIVKEKMEKAVELKVPIKVDMKKGKNWSEMKRVSKV